MIIDAFMFFNEYDILEGRLEYLYDTVDYFVIVESDRTHSGASKSLNYVANMARYKKYSDKILYFPYSPDTTSYHDSHYNLKGSYSPEMAMKMDHDQRNYIAQALKLFGPDVTVMISDLDEIPSKNAIEVARNNIDSTCIAVAFTQEMFYYNLKQKQIDPWMGTVLTTNREISKKNPQFFRESRWNLPRVTEGGWHISYWGSPEKIRNKILNFAHQEFNSEEYSDVDKISKRVMEGKDLYNRPGGQQFIPVDRSFLQHDLLSVFEKYEKTYIPHFYKNVEGWFSEEDIIYYKEMFDKFNGPAHFVEIGSYKGRSSSFMAVEIANSGKDIKFDCVDTWEGSPEHQLGGILEDADVVNDTMFDVFKKNMEPVNGYYNTLRMTSVEASKLYEDNSLDFVFIDADHQYESVVEDILSWFPKVKNGGIIGGHDYHLGAPGVIQASRQILKGVRSIGDCWYAVVKKQ